MLNRLALLFTLAAFSWVVLATTTTQAQDKLQLSDELRRVIESEGVPAAKQFFSEVYPAHQDEYTIDTQSLMMLASQYISAGNMEAGQAMGEITSVITQDMVSSAMTEYAPAMQQQMEEMQRMEEAQAAQADHGRAAEQQVQEQKATRDRGKSRDDLQRFVGLYGAPGDSRNNRQLFVTVSCDGYLVVGPMWADVSPWWMRSAADTVFTYADSFISLALEFNLRENGEVESLAHDLESLASPLQHVGPLPDEWGGCAERSWP